MLTQGCNVLLHGVFDDAFFKHLRATGVKKVFLMEGRPKLDAAQKNSQKLLKRGIKPVLIADNMPGFLFRNNLIRRAWVAYQDHDKSGALCGIGALIVGVLAKKHRIPVYLYKGVLSKHLLGSKNDLLNFLDTPVAPKGVSTFVPLVEWLPAKYITKIYDEEQ